MLWLYLIIVSLTAMVIFVAQNRESVNVSFLGFSLHTPLALLTANVHVPGAIGCSLFGLLRKSIRELRLTGAQ